MTVDVRASACLWMARAVIVLGWLAILCGFGLFGWDCLAWLRDGVWRQSSLADVWGHVPLGGDRAPAGWEQLRGLHYLLYRALHWFGRFPVDLAAVVAGLAVAWVGNDVHDRAERDLARSARRSVLR